MENNWIENNKQSPKEPGMYETKDSAGFESYTRWTGIYWPSQIGHPVEFWKEPAEEPTDRQIEKMLTQ